MLPRKVLLVLVATLAGLLMSEGQGWAANPGSAGMGAFLTYCLPALVAHDDAARLARMEKLKQIVTSSRDTVFQLPGDVSLVVSGPAVCSVFVHTVDPAKFLGEVNLQLARPPAPFVKQDESTSGGLTKRKYAGRVGATNIVVFVAVWQHPKQVAPQAIITGGRQ